MLEFFRIIPDYPVVALGLAIALHLGIRYRMSRPLVEHDKVKLVLCLSPVTNQKGITLMRYTIGIIAALAITFYCRHRLLRRKAVKRCHNLKSTLILQPGQDPSLNRFEVHYREDL